MQHGTSKPFTHITHETIFKIVFLGISSLSQPFLSLLWYGALQLRTTADERHTPFNRTP
jgi:hypothetical protein